MPLIINNEENTEENNVTETPIVDNTENVTTEEVAVNLPKIELIIEDGTCVPNSNSYCDLDYALKYCVEKGYTSWLDLTEDEQKIFLIRGTDFIDNFYDWKGYSRKGQFQSMAFPRDRVFDDRGFELIGIPDKLKKACVEAAYINATSSDTTLFETKDYNGNVKKQVVDSISVEYFQKTETASVNYSSIYEILNKLLKGLYKTEDERSSVCTRGVWL